MEAMGTTVALSSVLQGHHHPFNQTSSSLRSTGPPPKVMQLKPQIENRAQLKPQIDNRANPHLDTSLATKSLSSLDEVMQYLESSSKSGRALDSVFYNSLVSLCISEKALYEGAQVRSHIVNTGHKPSIFLENQFINLYAKCGDMETAREVFDKMRQRNSVSWNATISGYCLNQQFQEALSLFCLMTETGLPPNQSAYLSALRASVGLGNPGHGEQIHAQVIKTGFYQNVQLGNALINMYAKLSNLEYAEIVYGSMAECDEVSWNSIITANAQNGCSDRAMILFVEMLKEGLNPNEFVFGSILGSCSIIVVKMLHAQITKTGYDANVFVMTALLNAYASNQKLQDAHLVFCRVPERNIVAWNAIIAAYIENRCIKEGLRLFLQMEEETINPDKYTIASLLKGMAIQATIEEGKQFHVLAIKSGSYKDSLVGNSLITMYSKHGELCYSLQAFENIENPDLVSWNSMLFSYLQNERSEQALIFFQEIRLSGIKPDEFTYVGVLEGCTTLGWYQTGKSIHGSLIKTGVALNAFVGSSLVDMYSKSGVVSDAKRAFEEIKVKDLIAWNFMIVGLAQNRHGHDALKLFCSMKEENWEPDNFTFASLLSGCADAMAVQQGRQVHCLILKSRITADIAVVNALITMYANFGSTEEAERVFYRLETEKTLVTWTAMIGCYAQNGCTIQALELFNQMENCKMKPNGITFVALLTACSHAGLTKQAEQYFDLMTAKYGITPGLEHYACMVDGLGRAGRLKEAENFIEGMPPEPNALVWKMLLSACRTHGDLHRGKRAMERILALEPDDSAAYILISNIYAAHGMWKDVVEVRKLMKENGLKKETGKSWIEVHCVIHEFGANDHSHPQANDIYKSLHELFIQMKVAGYGADPDSVLHEKDYMND